MTSVSTKDTTSKMAVVNAGTPERGKPFLKWAGGKQWLSQKLATVINLGGGTYYEPFLGAGSLFFALQPKKAVLGDANLRLMETFQVVRDSPNNLLNLLKQLQYDKRNYYSVRESRFSNKVVRAAQFIYLNRTCWNGLYRVNLEGKFNVPCGRIANPRICDAPNVLAASKVLRSARLRSEDFRETVEDAGDGDFVYCDPPYTVKHSNNGFLKYNEEIFSWEMQKELAKGAAELVERGCWVIVSNAVHPEIEALYKSFHKILLDRTSLIAGSSSGRGKVSELIFSSRAIDSSALVYD